MADARTDTPTAEHTAARTFNDTNPIGTPVRYWKGAREGDGKVARTRTQAQLLSGHTAVVWLEGVSGCIALTHIQPISEEELAAADRIPAPRPVPTFADRTAALEELRAERVKTGRLEGDLRSQTQAVLEVTAERDAARNDAKQAAQLADFRQGVIYRHRQELGGAGEVLAVVRDAAERIDRALATYDTTPGGEPEPDQDEDQGAVQNLLDESTRAFAAADTSSERVEVIRDLLAGWYAHWPKTAVTDPHEPIAWQVASLISAAEARASSVPSRRAQEPQPGQFCAKHFSWLCQAGQGRCQNDAENAP